MAYLRYPSASQGLGQAQVIAALLGPLVGGGADIYSTYEGSKLSKKELKQRQREFEAIQKLRREQLAAQERQQGIAQQSALQQAQISQYFRSRNMPYILGAVVVVSVAVVAAAVLKGGK